MNPEMSVYNEEDWAAQQAIDEANEQRELAVLMGKEPTCKPISLHPITGRVVVGWDAERTNSPLPKPLACPFCGDDAHTVADSEADWRVTCNGNIDEECRGIMQEPMGYLTERFAVEAWNKRK